MKDFHRFPHEGVRHELEVVMAAFSGSPRYSFGSSGDGELTIRGPEATAYVRKYRNGRPGWRVHICPPGIKTQPEYPRERDEVLSMLRRAL